MLGNGAQRHCKFRYRQQDTHIETGKDIMQCHVQANADSLRRRGCGEGIWMMGVESWAARN